MQLNKASAIFDTKETHPASCLKNEVWHRLLLRKKIQNHQWHFCTEKFMLIPMNWVPASYIAKISPSHLMASLFSSKIIAFFTCYCLWFSASAGYLKSYFEITDFKVCKLSDAYFSLSVTQRREKKKQQKK